MPGMSEEFIKEQFPKQYVKKQGTNMALQCQRVNIYEIWLGTLSTRAAG